MEAQKLAEHLATNTATQHRAETKELQHEVELFRELPGISRILPSDEAKLFDQVFDQLAQTIDDLVETESQTHPAASVWKEFYDDYGKINDYLQIAGTSPTEEERAESLWRAAIAADDATRRMGANLLFHKMGYDTWEKQAEYLGNANEVITQMVSRSMGPAAIYIKESQDAVRSTRNMNPIFGENLFTAVAKITEEGSRTIKNAFEYLDKLGKDARGKVYEALYDFDEKMTKIADTWGNKKIFFDKSLRDITESAVTRYMGSAWTQNYKETISSANKKLRNMLFGNPQEDGPYVMYEVPDSPYKLMDIYWDIKEYGDTIRETTEPYEKLAQRAILWADNKVFNELPQIMEMALARVGQKALDTLDIPLELSKKLEQNLAQLQGKALENEEYRLWAQHDINQRKPEYIALKDNLLDVFTETLPDMNRKERASLREGISDCIRDWVSDKSNFDIHGVNEDILQSIYMEIDNRFPGSLDAEGSRAWDVGCSVLYNESTLKNILTELSPVKFESKRSQEEVFSKVFDNPEGAQFKSHYEIRGDQVALDLPKDYMSRKEYQKAVTAAERKAATGWSR